MRTTMKVSIATLAFTAGLAACGDSRSTDAATDELQRDLQLASASTMNLAGPRVDSALLTSMETKPQGVPEATATVRRGAGPRAVRSEAPTVEATPDVDLADLEESDEVETESVAPAPEPTNEPVAVAPRPVPVIIQTGGAGDYGTSGNGGGIFGGGGGRGGVVIRGGGVDGDNCELHRGRGGVIARGPIYMPVPVVPRSTGGVTMRPRTPSQNVGTRPTSSSGMGSRPMTMRPRGGIR